MRIRILPGLLLLSLAACGGDDGPNPVDTPDANVPQPDANTGCEPTAVLPTEWRPINMLTAGTIENLAEPGVVFVDATAGGFGNTADNPYIYLKFDTTAGTVSRVDITDTQSYTDSTWDIALKRYVIRANSGDSGPGGITVAPVNVATLAEVTEAPAPETFVEDDWVSDACVYNMGPLGEPQTAVGFWYDYDGATMRLSPKPMVFVLKRADGATIKFLVRTYYYNNLPGANYEIEWATL